MSEEKSAYRRRNKAGLVYIRESVIRFNIVAMDMADLWTKPGVNIIKTVDGLTLCPDWDRFTLNIIPYGGTFSSKPLMNELNIQGTFTMEPIKGETNFLLTKVDY